MVSTDGTPFAGLKVSFFPFWNGERALASASVDHTASYFKEVILLSSMLGTGAFDDNVLNLDGGGNIIDCMVNGEETTFRLHDL